MGKAKVLVAGMVLEEARDGEKDGWRVVGTGG